MQLPAYQTPNALLNFSPLNEGIDSYRKGQEDVRRYGVAQESGNALMRGDYKGAMSTALRGDRADLAGVALSAQQNERQQADADLNRQYKMIDRMGRIAAAAADDPNPENRAKAHQYLISQHPNRAGLDPLYLNPETGLKMMAAEAGQHKSALEKQMEQAKLGLTNAQIAKTYADAENTRKGGDAPMPIKEWNQYQKMPDEQKSQYLLMKRAAEKPLDTGTAFVRPDALKPGLPPAQIVQKDVAGKEYQQEVGTAAGKAAASLPTVISATNRMVSSIDAVLNDQGLASVTGLVGGRIPRQMQTPALAATQSRLDQMSGQSFLQAYNELRGAGQITEKEGEKAEAAYSRLKTQTMGTKDYIDATKELRNEVLKLASLAKTRAQRPGMQPPPSAAPAGPPENGGWSARRLD